MPTLASAGGQAARVVLSQDAGAKLQLEARQQPLPQILKTITEKTGVPIHYSALPKQLVTVTCVGTTVKQVLECLFDKKADLIFRYANNTAQNHPEEAWVLGTNFAAEETPATTGMETKTDDADEVDKLLERVKTGDPVQRADAVAGLAAEKQANEGSINSALVSALSDKNAEVRAQAVSGLTSRDSSDAPAALQNAMQDDDASVRLMAVDSAGDNIALLQQALGDSDETVRAYAAIKLEAFSNAAKAQ
ncbi:MAG: HEAT repeat domain-containing protein [Methylococcaceae bacterium]